jgi:hypothetical protein
VFLLLFQAAAFLPENTGARVTPDAAFLSRCAETARSGTVDWKDLGGLRPDGPKQEAALIHFLHHGTPQEARLAAVLGAGTPANSPLADALFRVSCRTSDPALALSCLLSAENAGPEHLPALAYLALDSALPLSIRAAALGRLLERDCVGAWPLAGSLFRLGTPQESHPPGSSWARTGQYELPKRLLLGSAHAWLRMRGLPPSSFEPNASWKDQREALASLQAAVDNAGHSPSWCPDMIPVQLMDRLLQAALKAPSARAMGLPREGRALALLWPLTRGFLAQAAGTGPGNREMVVHILAAVGESP